MTEYESLHLTQLQLVILNVLLLLLLLFSFIYIYCLFLCCCRFLLERADLKLRDKYLLRAEQNGSSETGQNDEVMSSCTVHV